MSDCDSESRSCPECDSEDWEIFDSVPVGYTDQPGIRCKECGITGTAGDFDGDVWMWGWP